MHIIILNFEKDLGDVIFCCGACALIGGNENRIENAQLEPKKTSSNGSMCFFFVCVLSVYCTTVMYPLNQVSAVVLSNILSVLCPSITCILGIELAELYLFI